MKHHIQKKIRLIVTHKLYAIQFSADNEEKIWKWFYFSEIVRLMMTSELCDKVNINFQTTVDVGNITALAWQLWKKKTNANFTKPASTLNALSLYCNDTDHELCVFAFKLDFFHEGRRKIYICWKK
jgi:hypothetical protein